MKTKKNREQSLDRNSIKTRTKIGMKSSMFIRDLQKSNNCGELIIYYYLDDKNCRPHNCYFFVFPYIYCIFCTIFLTVIYEFLFFPYFIYVFTRTK